MPLPDIIAEGAIIPALRAESKKHLLKEIATRASDLTGRPAQEIFHTLVERENLGSTGAGGGIAIPHGKLEGLKTVLGFLAVLQEPIEYGAIDDLPVDVVVLLLSPREAGTEHLKALARVSRVLRDREFLAKLRGAGSPDAIYALLSTYQARDAA